MHGLAHTERNRDQVGDERHPQPKRDRNGQLLLDELEHADVTEVALAEIEQQIVLEHYEKALIGGLIEAELLLELPDKFRIETLRAAVFGTALAEVLAGLPVARAAQTVALAAADARRGGNIGARTLGDHAFNRTTRRELNDSEADQHDPEHGRNDQQQSFQEIACHQAKCSVSLVDRFQFGGLISIIPPAIEDTAIIAWLGCRARKLVPVGDVVRRLVPLRDPVVPGA